MSEGTGTTTKKSRKGWWIAGGVLLLVLLGVGVGLWLWRRKAKAADGGTTGGGSSSKTGGNMGGTTGGTDQGAPEGDTGGGGTGDLSGAISKIKDGAGTIIGKLKEVTGPPDAPEFDPYNPEPVPIMGKAYAVVDGDSMDKILRRAGFEPVELWSAKTAMWSDPENLWIGTTGSGSAKTLKLLHIFLKLPGKDYGWRTDKKYYSWNETGFPLVRVPKREEI